MAYIFLGHHVLPPLLCMFVYLWKLRLIMAGWHWNINNFKNNYKNMFFFGNEGPRPDKVPWLLIHKASLTILRCIGLSHLPLREAETNRTAADGGTRAADASASGLLIRNIFTIRDCSALQQFPAFYRQVFVCGFQCFLREFLRE